MGSLLPRAPTEGCSYDDADANDDDDGDGGDDGTYGEHLGRVSPKLSQLGCQLTERQLDNTLNSSFYFTNVRHVKSYLSQLTDDHAFSLAELSLVRFEINCCHGNTNRLYTCHSISQYSGI